MRSNTLTRVSNNPGAVHTILNSWLLACAAMVSVHAKDRTGCSARISPSRHSTGQSQAGDLFL